MCRTVWIKVWKSTEEHKRLFEQKDRKYIKVSIFTQLTFNFNIPN